ncbi:MAG: hypothetical protein VX278_11200 [Myxococcota bacterium]|nr:hypothetical protein [Myxococcota bacterium]
MGGRSTQTVPVQTEKRRGVTQEDSPSGTRILERKRKNPVVTSTQNSQDSSDLRRDRNRNRGISILDRSKDKTNRTNRNRQYRRSQEESSSSAASQSPQKRESRTPKSSSSCSGNVYRIGLRGGLHAGALNSGDDRSGTGAAFGFRSCNSRFGVEVSHISYGESFNVDIDSPLQLSAQMHLSPSGIFSPFLSAGVSSAYHSASKESAIKPGVAFGPHFGLGLQSKLGPIAVNVEGRYLKYNNEEIGSQLQAIAGIDLHF